MLYCMNLHYFVSKKNKQKYACIESSHQHFVARKGTDREQTQTCKRVTFISYKMGEGGIGSVREKTQKRK